jgi:hypothetical protein
VNVRELEKNLRLAYRFGDRLVAGGGIRNFIKFVNFDQKLRMIKQIKEKREKNGIRKKSSLQRRRACVPRGVAVERWKGE